jgi:superfamily II DNA or RNA helicase
MKLGLYEQILNTVTSNELKDLNLDLFSVGKEALDVEEARKLLAHYISLVTRRALKLVREQNSDDQDAVLAQIRICNELIATMRTSLGQQELEDYRIDEQGEVLTYVYSKLNHIRGIKDDKVIRPVTPLSQSSLFTGSHAEPNMLSELQHEIVTSDRIDMLVSFIKWSGLRCLMEQLEQFTESGGHLRVITTTYMEATDLKAIQELSRLKNTEIQISYDSKRTRLHAKAYVFRRETGFTTAYIGSSNLSNPALTSGLEWNLKVTEKDSYDVLQKVFATFESYWNDREFKPFHIDNQEHVDQLRDALNRKKDSETTFSFNFDISPYDYQKEILDKLAAQRTLHGRFHNLVVAATGVGKTVIAAFDYKRFKQNNPRARLLFVAHREEILKQSRDTFRAILKDLNFGELHVGRDQANSLDHLFISIQSFNSMRLDERTTDDFYDYIVVDEFHHAAAPSYQRLLSYYKPKILLGLTATPERMDGKSILSYFDDTIAAEIRLTEAVDRKLLSPFQYFGVTDEVDLTQVKWTRRGYDLLELENLYTNNKIRVTQILNSLKKYVTDLDDVRGLGFCVSVEHAIYMAKVFQESGISSIALHGNSSDEERNQVKGRLVRGEIKMIFVVDLYNEGVDIPEVNTILFLRPTESLTVFLQQLGRGLRLADGKECLTVLDFIGQAHASYNFQDKFRALMGRTKHSITYYMDNGFSNLPRGCFIQLEKQAKEYVLRNLKDANYTRRNVISKLKHFQEDTGMKATIENFLDYYQIDLYELYGRNGDRTFGKMMVEAEIKEDFVFYNEIYLTKRLPALIAMNSRVMLGYLLEYFLNKQKPQTLEEHLLLSMFYYTFYSSAPSKEGFDNIEAGVQAVVQCEEFCDEIVQILAYNLRRLDFVDLPNPFPYVCPLDVHCRYTTSQVLTAFGYFNEEKAPEFREGVKYFEDRKTDIFFITLNKSDKDFSPSTLYEDYAINERLFHWQTQSRTTEKSNMAQRYIHHRKMGNRIALFVREYKKENGYTSPFVYLGEAEYVRHEGDRPISFVWRLKEELPPMLVPVANKCIV